MRRIVKRYVRRHEPGGIRPYQIKAGIGAGLALIALGVLAHVTGRPLLLAPFGASCVLLFGQPRSPLAQPVNVLGGYLVASLCTLVMMGLFPGSLVAAGLAVGVSITAMLALRLSHPPAGAVPLVAMMSPLGIGILLESVMGGAALLVIMAIVYHHLPPRQTFPLDIDLG